MDLSALIFVALAVAWAVYLIPKALRQHEDSAASRSIDGFSDRMRVLARREAVDARVARLVVPGRPAAVIEAGPADAPVEPVVAPTVELATTEQHRARRAAAARAAKRRLRVVSVILVALVAVVTVAALGRIPLAYIAIPVGVLVAWLVACRVMVKHERAAHVPAIRRTTAAPEADVDDDPLTDEIAVIRVEADLSAPAETPVETPETPETPEALQPQVPGGWDLVPTTLPTYVGKEPARRSVRTIDLDSTGVWSSGASASDSALAREAEESERAARTAAAEAERRRASGS